MDRGPPPHSAEGKKQQFPTLRALPRPQAGHLAAVCAEVDQALQPEIYLCFAERAKGRISFRNTAGVPPAALAVPGQNPRAALAGGEPSSGCLPRRSAAREAGCRQCAAQYKRPCALAEDRRVRRTLAEAGLSFVFLQFDGTGTDVYRALRGRFPTSNSGLDNCAPTWAWCFFFVKRDSLFRPLSGSQWHL